MKIRSRLKAGTTVLLLSAGLLWFLWPATRPDDGARFLPPEAPAPAYRSPAALIAVKPAGNTAGPGRSSVRKESPEIEKLKEIERQNLGRIRDGIFAYRKKYGTYPEYLSQLSPEFVTQGTLVSPKERTGGAASILSSDHPDPGMKKSSYGYEFSNLEFRDGRTFAEIKEIQRADWGDAIPLLRVFGYDKVINMSWGGEIYETELNWEWDSATLDMVDKLGWGPGLQVGEMAKVRVMGPDGTPLGGAKVWADGRSYSFDLPDRPFTADADGWVKIPVGADLDRTALALRLEAGGYTAPVMKFQSGGLPDETTITATRESMAIGGTLQDADGTPLPATRILLRRDGGAGPVLAQVKTDENGRWTAEVHPSDASNLAASVGLPGTMYTKNPGQPLDAASAAGKTAVIVAPVSR